jgi:hypothetical protein
MADQQDPKKAKIDQRVREFFDGAEPEFLKAVKREFDNRAKLGRPKGSGQNDSESIAFMVNLLGKRQVQNETDAVSAAVLRSPGHSPAATRKRLHRKLREHLRATAKSPEEVAREARRAEILRRAFEEDVGWDI